MVLEIQFNDSPSTSKAQLVPQRHPGDLVYVFESSCLQKKVVAFEVAYFHWWHVNSSIVNSSILILPTVISSSQIFTGQLVSQYFFAVHTSKKLMLVDV